MDDPVGGSFGVDLEAYKDEERLSWAQLAIRVGARDKRQVIAWAKGSERPQSAEAVERIGSGTNGRVTVWAMHRKRLVWERAQAEVRERARRFREVA